MADRQSWKARPRWKWPRLTFPSTQVSLVLEAKKIRELLPINAEYDKRHKLSIVESSTVPFAMRSIMRRLALTLYCCKRSLMGEKRLVRARILQASSSDSLLKSPTSSYSKHHIGCLWQYSKYNLIPRETSTGPGLPFVAISIVGCAGGVASALLSFRINSFAGGLAEIDFSDTAELSSW